jgi:hypothetical protein
LTPENLNQKKREIKEQIKKNIVETKHKSLTEKLDELLNPESPEQLPANNDVEILMDIDEEEADKQNKSVEEIEEN